MKNLCALIFIVLLSHVSFAELVTVPYVDLGRYAGTWYQIARNPFPFEEGCICSKQILTPKADGTIGVYNSCRDKVVDGPLREISGFAVVDDKVSNAKLTVDFGLPHKGTYWIIGLDSDYKYAVVSDRSEMSLYILSKTPQLDARLYSEAIMNASKQIDTSRLYVPEQSACIY